MGEQVEWLTRQGPYAAAMGEDGMDLPDGAQADAG